MKLLASDIFYVITGFPIPDNVLPEVMRGQTLGLTKTLELLCGEKVYCFQTERIRQECKTWLFKKHNFLVEWNLGHDLLMTPGIIEAFFNDIASKTPSLEVESIPSEFHVSMDPLKEKVMLNTNSNYRNVFYVEEDIAPEK